MKKISYKILFTFLVLPFFCNGQSVIYRDFWTNIRPRPEMIFGNSTTIVRSIYVKPFMKYNNDSIESRGYFQINSSLDTASIFHTALDSLNIIKGYLLGSFENSHYFLTSKPNFNNPNGFYTGGGNATISKFGLRGKKFWEYRINPQGVSEDYYLGNIWQSYQDSSNNFWIVGSRFWTPNGFTTWHPYVMGFDTAGLSIAEYDIPTTMQSFGRFLFPLDSGQMAIVGSERDLDTSYLAVWKIKLNPFRVVSKENYAERCESWGSPEGENVVRIEFGPNNQRFIYGKYRVYRKLPWGQYRSKDTIIAEMRQGANGPIQWRLPNKDVLHSAFLVTGELYVFSLADTGYYSQYYDPNTGNLLRSQFISAGPNGRVGNGSIRISQSTHTDSGHLFINSVIAIGRPIPTGHYKRIYCLQNVGQVWRPWNSVTGILKSMTKNSLHAYPNPTTGRLRLRGLKETEGVSLRVFNNQGQEVWKGSPSTEGEIDISSLPIGLYHLEALNAQGQRWSTRVVRE